MLREKALNFESQEPPHERQPRSVLRRIGNQALNSAPRWSRQLRIEDFQGVYGARKLESNKNFVAKREQEYERHDQENQMSDHYAKNFERTFLFGLDAWHWLGNISDQQEDEKQFFTRSYLTTPYDDYLHRADLVTTLHLAQPEELENGEKLDAIPLAFDVTVSNDPARIHEKLLVSCHDGAKLPFGFTHLDYYSDGSTLANLPLCPRYVIGISSKEAREIKPFSPSNPRSTSPELTVANLEMRFKVLSEIRAQNELIAAMFPDDIYDSTDLQAIRATAYVEKADEVLHNALRVCADTLMKVGALPKEVMKQIKADPQGQRLIVEKYMLAKSQRSFQFDYESVIERGEREVADPYNEIVGYSRKLCDMLFDNSQIGTEARNRLEANRRIMAHNFNIGV